MVQIVFGRDTETMTKNYMSTEQAAAGVNKWRQEGWYPEQLKHSGRVCIQDVLNYALYLQDPEGYLAETLRQVEEG